MIYPKWVFCMNETVTSNNMKMYEKMVINWNKKRDEMFPNYYDKDLRSQLEMAKQVDDVMGYSI